jgi:hypothetical protein
MCDELSETISLIGKMEVLIQTELLTGKKQQIFSGEANTKIQKATDFGKSAGEF